MRMKIGSVVFTLLLALTPSLPAFSASHTWRMKTSINDFQFVYQISGDELHYKAKKYFKFPNAALYTPDGRLVRTITKMRNLKATLENFPAKIATSKPKSNAADLQAMRTVLNKVAGKTVIPNTVIESNRWTIILTVMPDDPHHKPHEYEHFKTFVRNFAKRHGQNLNFIELVFSAPM